MKEHIPLWLWLWTLGFTFPLWCRHNHKRNHNHKKMTDHFLMIIIMSIISVFMIVFFGALSYINVFMTMFMIVMSPEGTSPQPTKTHARLYQISKCIPYNSSGYCNKPRSQPLEHFHPYGTVEGEICHCYTCKNIPKSHRLSLLMDLRVYCHHVFPRSHEDSCSRHIPG